MLNFHDNLTAYVPFLSAFDSVEMSSLNVFLMTSQVCIHFAQHMAEAMSAFWHHLRHQYLVKVLLFALSWSHLVLYQWTINEPVWMININHEYSLFIMNVINTTFWHISVKQEIGFIFIGVVAKH